MSTTAGQEPPRASLFFATTSPLLTAVPRRPADGFHGVLFIHDLGEPKVTWGDTRRGEALPGTPLVPANGSQGPRAVLGGCHQAGNALGCSTSSGCLANPPIFRGASGERSA